MEEKMTLLGHPITVTPIKYMFWVGGHGYQSHSAFYLRLEGHDASARMLDADEYHRLTEKLRGDPMFQLILLAGLVASAATIWSICRVAGLSDEASRRATLLYKHGRESMTDDEIDALIGKDFRAEIQNLFSDKGDER